jgi:hypothetical protein
MSFDLAELSNAKVDDVTFDVAIEHPVKGPTPIVIQVIGLHSEKVRALRDQMANASLKENFEAQRKGKPPKVTVAEATNRNASLLAAATVGWFTQEDQGVGKKPLIEQGVPWNGGRLQFSEEEAAKLYSDPAYDWLTKQVDDAVGELANFMKS